MIHICNSAKELSPTSKDDETAKVKDLVSWRLATQDRKNVSCYEKEKYHLALRPTITMFSVSAEAKRSHRR